MPTASKRRLVPLALLLGTVCSFVACCLAGRVVAGRNCFPNFQRFHPFLSPETLFYPTACQVRALARTQLLRDKVAVIVGGTSILHGVGQRPERAWTRHLQDELGDGYRVINLAMPGAFPFEFGGAAAEMLSCDFPRLIYISDVFLRHGMDNPPPPLVAAAAVPHATPYGYFFWDVYFKGRLPTDATRASALRAWTRACAVDPRAAELLRGLRVDALTYSRDLWTSLACTHLCTIWTRPNPPWTFPFTVARRQCPECSWDMALPVFKALNYGPERMAMMTRSMRAEATDARLLLQRIAAERTSGSPLAQSYALLPPPSLRGHTLLLSVRHSPYFVNRLTPAERAAYRAALPAFVRELEKVGFAALGVESGYSDADFLDHCHLSEGGGEKLAREVAPAVRRLAHRLGYDEGERGVSTPRFPAAPPSGTGGLTPPARPSTGGLTPPARPSTGGLTPPARPSTGGLTPPARQSRGGTYAGRP